MIRNIVFALLLVIGAVISAPAADTVEIKANSTTLVGEPVVLTGKLTKPQGDGPFPGVVLLHDCLGPMPEYEVPWVERLTKWGYVTLRVDSFGPRGESSTCMKPLDVAPWTRAQDAHDAKSYIAGLPFVDGNKIAVIGSGAGGWATLHSVDKETSIQERGSPFQAAVAFYPYCHVPEFNSEAPVLILIGEFSGMWPAEKCSDLANKGGSVRNVTLKIYPGTYQSFDLEGAEEIWKENPREAKYNPEATTDAIARVKDFLAKHLK